MKNPGMFVFIAALTIAAIGCSTIGPAVDETDFIRRVESDARRTMARSGIEGLSIVVADHNGTIMARGFGSAGDGRDMSASTPMLLASVTKLFTAVAVMTLVEDGFVDLDAPIGTYVPEMAGVSYPGSPEPTVRNLLTHHGGLASDLLKGTLYSGPTAGYTTAFMDLVPLMATLPPTEPPELLAHYSNIGYSLLGALITNVAGLDYVDYVETAILDPLVMHDSGFLDPATDDTLSRGFIDGQETRGLRMTGLPEGGLASSTADLGRFISMLLNSGAAPNGAAVLAPDTLNRMLVQQNAGVALDFDFEKGLGFNLMTLPGFPEVQVAWHDGGTRPFASTLLIAPDHGVGVAILSNTNESVPEDFSYEVVARAIEMTTGERPVSSHDYVFGAAPGRLLQAEELAGTYATEIGSLTVAGSPRRPIATLAGMELHLVEREAGSYGLQARVAGIPLPIRPLTRIRLMFREIDGERAVAYYEGGKFRSIGLAVEPAPVPPEWENRYGTWHVTNPDTDPFVHGLSLYRDGESGFLTVSVSVASIPEPVVLAVEPVDQSNLVVSGLGRHLGEHLSVVNRGTEQIHWAGLIFEQQ